MSTKTDMPPQTTRYFTWIVVFFASALLISNLCATKPIQFGPIPTDGGGLLFPVTYIFGDIMTEVYGYRYARRAIWSAFAVMVFAVGAFYIVSLTPGAPGWNGQSAYEQILGFFPRIVLASLLAFLTGEFLNSFVLAKLKVRTQGRAMWLRLTSSTVVGELADTTVFGLVAFSGIFHGWSMAKFILIGWGFKTCYEFVMLPVTYRVIAALKRAEGVDVYDRATNFTPLSLSLESGRSNDLATRS